jgi:hypothetical protein
MSERAALYTVAVRANRGKDRPLGDIDGNGTSLGDALAKLLDGFNESSPDGARIALASVAMRDGDDLLAIVQHGARGVAADIVDASGGVRLRQTPDDVQLVRCGCLFRLPAAATSGSLAVQISNGRGVKGLFEQGLTARFRAAYAGLAVAIEPLADSGALASAVAADRIEKLRLVRLEPAGERAIADTDKWVVLGAPARVELDVSPVATGTRLERSLLERYLGGDSAAFAEIVSFAGLIFDQARVSAVFPDGTRRLFDLAHPASGRVTKELVGITLDEAGEPTNASLLAALRAALS